jgi:hypothetical protein
MTQTQTWPDDLPDLDEPGPTIIRHSFGGLSALIVLVALLALGILVTHLIIADRNSIYHYSLAPARLFSYSAELRAMATRKTPDDDWESDPQRRAEKEAIEWYFRILDPHDADKLKVFLDRFQSHPYAERKGYARTARQALAHLQHVEDEAAERRRREAQKAVPWDLGVKPPKSFD